MKNLSFREVIISVISISLLIGLLGDLLVYRYWHKPLADQYHEEKCQIVNCTKLW